MSNGRALNTRQVSELLSVSESTVRKLARQGELPCFRVSGSGKLRFAPHDIKKFIENNRVPANEGIQRHPSTKGLIYLEA